MGRDLNEATDVRLTFFYWIAGTLTLSISKQFNK